MENKSDINKRIDDIKTELFYLDMIDYQTRKDREKIRQLKDELKKLKAEI